MSLYLIINCITSLVGFEENYVFKICLESLSNLTDILNINKQEKNTVKEYQCLEQTSIFPYDFLKPIPYS